MRNEARFSCPTTKLLPDALMLPTAAVGVAPEARQERQSEAPDAGDGRANWLEHEFTHGRSQS